MVWNRSTLLQLPNQRPWSLAKKTLFSFCLTYKISKFAEHVNLSIPVMKKFFLFILNLLLLTACGNRTQTSYKPLIMVSIEPLRYFTEIIAGDKFKVESMVPEGSNPEFYDPTPQQIISLTKSKAFLRIGQTGYKKIHPTHRFLICRKMLIWFMKIILRNNTMHIYMALNRTSGVLHKMLTS